MIAKLGLQTRTAFSLLEVIIATAILASSAMVLTSLLGLGTKFGNRAEARTLAMSQAQSLLDEFLAMPQSDRSGDEEQTGELAGFPPRTFRIKLAPFSAWPTDSVASPTSFELENTSNRGGGSANTPKAALTCITVEIFETNNSSQTEVPLCRISRLIRSHRLHPTDVRGSGLASQTERFLP